MLDIGFVRQQFPALGQGWALFDNAGGSAPLRGVIDTVADFMARHPVQLGASYELSAEASARVRAGHLAAAELIGAEPDEVVLGPSTTLNVRLLASALRPLWKEGDEVVVTNLDHEANSGPWRRLGQTGITVREWRVRPETAQLEIDDLDRLLGERTRLVAFSHCSNIVGAVNDVARATRRVHEAGGLVCVDGVAYAPHRPVEVKTWDVDFYVFSLYKAYGPHLGLLYGKREHLLRARGQNHFFHQEDDLPGKLEPGNANHELSASLPAIVDYLETLGSRDSGPSSGRSPRIGEAYALIRAHEQQLVSPLLELLRGKRRVRIIGPTTPEASVRVPTVSFVVDSLPSSQIPPLLDRERIAIRWGHFYAYRLIRDLGLLDQGGVVRVSMVHYNTSEEVARLIEVLDRVL